MVKVTGSERLIKIPGSVQFGLNNSHPGFTILFLNGPQGKNKKIYIRSDIRVVINAPFISLISYSSKSAGLCGVYARLIENSILGLEKDFKIYVELRGLGYRLKSHTARHFEFFVGYSHLIKIVLPELTTGRVLGSKSRTLELKGPDWAQLNQTAEQLKTIRRPNPYKEKGIFRRGEKALLKEGKKKKI